MHVCVLVGLRMLVVIMGWEGNGILARVSLCMCLFYYLQYIYSMCLSVYPTIYGLFQYALYEKKFSDNKRKIVISVNNLKFSLEVPAFCSTVTAVMAALPEEQHHNWWVC